MVSGMVGRLSRWADPVASVGWLTVRQLLTRGRLLALGGFLLLPAFVSFLYAASDASVAPERFLARLCDGLVLTTVLPLVALVFGGAAFGNEVEDGTLFYLVMKPVPRGALVAAKYAATAAVSAGLVAVSVLAATVIAGQDATTLRTGAAFAVASAAAAAAYSGLFLALGLVTTRTLVVGLAYIFLWEGVLSALFEGLRTLSVREYTRTVAVALADLPANVLRADLTPGGALLGIVLVAGVSVVLATHRLATMDVG